MFDAMVKPRAYYAFSGAYYYVSTTHSHSKQRISPYGFIDVHYYFDKC